MATVEHSLWIETDTLDPLTGEYETVTIGDTLPAVASGDWPTVPAGDDLEALADYVERLEYA